MIDIIQPESAAATDLLSWALDTFRGRFAICTSFQDEGMVILDMAAKLHPGVKVFTLDTGRLPAETRQMIAAVEARYGIEVEIVHPDAAEVERMTGLHGPDLFLDDPSLRKLCCHVRKTRPLARRLASLDAWAVGLRRDQNEERAHTPKAEQVDGRWKLSPLADWSQRQVEEYLRANAVPRHPLYASGYGTIGCAPCTRPIAPGEHPRAGRWWWEQDQAKECGIHIGADGAFRRTLDVLLEEIVVR